MKISGIIFDKDGTLLDFNEFWIPAAQCVIRRILSDYKIPVTDIHTEKALKNMVHTVLRDTNAGVCHFNIKILMVCIQCYTDPSFIYIIFNWLNSYKFS